MLSTQGKFCCLGNGYSLGSKKMENINTDGVFQKTQYSVLPEFTKRYLELESLLSV